MSGIMPKDMGSQRYGKPKVLKPKDLVLDLFLSIGDDWGSTAETAIPYKVV